jgi:hypothetical protein
MTHRRPAAFHLGPNDVPQFLHVALPVGFKPPYKLNCAEEAPFNVLLDWAFGVRIFRRFGIDQAHAVSRHSTLTLQGGAKRKRAD